MNYDKKMTAQNFYYFCKKYLENYIIKVYTTYK